MNWKKLVLTIVVSAFVMLPYLSVAQNAKEIVKKSDEIERGETSKATITMTIVRPTWKRSITMKSWTKGRDYSLTLITNPAKDKGRTFLKRKNEMWSWSPKTNRLIKMPPSMLSQGWMGSDYSNDDILKESSIVVDYTHKIVGSGNVGGLDCYKIELIPFEDADVVWGKLEMWVSKKDFFQMQVKYYDEDNYLVRTEKASKIKKMHDRQLPTYIEIIPADEPGKKTIIEINTAEFNIKIEDSFFSQQNMKRIR